MKVDNNKKMNNEISSLMSNLFSGKKITKKDIQRIKEIKNNRSKKNDKKR